MGRNKKRKLGDPGGGVTGNSPGSTHGENGNGRDMETRGQPRGQDGGAGKKKRGRDDGAAEALRELRQQVRGRGV